MDKNTNLAATLQLKVELSTEQIERILYDYVKEQFREIPADFAAGKVRFVITNAPTDMRGEFAGPATLSKAVVEITRESKQSSGVSSRDRRVWGYQDDEW